MRIDKSAAETARMSSNSSANAPTIHVYYASADLARGISTDRLMGRFSDRERSKLARLKREEDRILLLTSLVLLSKALGEHGGGDADLCMIQYTAAGRPFLPDAVFDFNLSHTDGCAAVAVGKHCRVGIDVEKMQEVDFDDFVGYFTPAQWEDISSAENRRERFYYYWTLLESAAKADGRGLPLVTSGKLHTDGRRLFIDNAEWFFHHPGIDPSISCCITTDKERVSFVSERVTSE